MIGINIWIKILTFISVIAIIILLVFNTEWFQFVKNGDIDSIVEENLFYSLFITLIAMIIQNTFTIIPLIFVITVNYTLYGFFNGFIWSWFTSIIGAAIMFMGSRYVFQDWVLKKMNPNLLTKIEKNGFLFVFQARIIPFIPTSLINILGGLSSIQFTPFILGTMSGNFIYFFVLSLIPAGFMNVNLNAYVLEAIFLLTIVSYFLYRKKLKSKKRHEATAVNKNNDHHSLK